MNNPALPAPPIGSLSTVVAEGRDARSFLNGQCTQNMLTLADSSTARAAFLTPQGRVIALALARAVGDSVRLLLPTDLAETLRSHLAKYVLRSKVQFAIETPDAADLGGSQAALGLTSAQTWALAKIQAGEPTVTAITSGSWIPQMLNLDLLDAISFQKGCYTGQEIVARTQHLGRIKRRMFRYRLAGSPPGCLDALLHEDVKVGEVVDATTDGDYSECLAVTALDCRDRELFLADGRRCVPAPLPYAIGD
jgi:folate-binding protein YgfZ